MASVASDLQIRRLLRSQDGPWDIGAQRTGLMSTNVIPLQAFSSHSDNPSAITQVLFICLPQERIYPPKTTNNFFLIFKILFEKYNTQQRIMSSPTALSQRKLYGKCNCDIWLG